MDRDHDQNFKNLILDYPRQALAFFAASEAAGIDESVTITPVRQEQLKARLGDRFRELDVPLLVEWPDGRREAFLFALEEETDPRRFSIRRLIHYCTDLTHLLETNRVVPVVIFLNPAETISESLTLGTEHTAYLHFHYLKCELARLPAEPYLESDNLVARINLPNMQWSPQEKVRIYAQAIRGLLELETDINKQLKYIDFVDIYTAMDDNEMKTYETEYPGEHQAMSGLREHLLQEGLIQGERSALLLMIRHRFGEPDASLQQRLERASREELEWWIERVTDAESLEEVFTQH